MKRGKAMPEIYFPNLNIKIQHLSRVAFNLFGLDVYWYGIIITIGIMAGLFLALQIAKKTGQDTEIYMDFLMYDLLFAFLGARLYYVLFELEYYVKHPIEVLHTRGGGLAIYGAVIASVITAIVYTHKKKIDFWKFADTAILGLIIGQAIGRWGNFVNREAFGDYTDSLFAMRIMKDGLTAPITETIANNIQIVNGVSYIQVHPTFLYESLWNLALLIILLVYFKHRKFDGEIFLLYLVGYGIGRLWIEGLRTDQLLTPIIKVPASQIVSALIAIFGIIAIIYKHKCKKNEKFF